MQKTISSFFKPAVVAAGPAKKRARDADADEQADAAGASSETDEQQGDESVLVVAKKPRLDVYVSQTHQRDKTTWMSMVARP